MTDRPDPPTELVEAVHDATRNSLSWTGHRREEAVTKTLDAVPDGWAKIDGKWREVDYVSFHDDNANCGIGVWERGRD